MKKVTGDIETGKGGTDGLRAQRDAINESIKLKRLQLNMAGDTGVGGIDVHPAVFSRIMQKHTDALSSSESYWNYNNLRI